MEVQNEKIRNICMLSTHGYFDPVPELGKTDTGGQVLYLLQLARSLTKKGIKVDIYTRWFDKDKPQTEPLPGCPDARVIRIPAGEWKFIPKEFIYDVLPELAGNMTEFIRHHRLDYDLFHGHYVDAGIVALDVAKVFSKPVFFTSHSLGAWKKQRVSGTPDELDAVFNFTHRIKEELRIFKSVDGQTATSIEEIDKIKELYDYSPAEIEFIPPGVDIEKFRALLSGEPEEKTRISLPEKYIFMVSRIAKVKGHNMLLPAFLKVSEEFPGIHLVIGGGTPSPDDEEKDVFAWVRQFANDNNLSDRVHLVGGIPNEELPPYYRQAEMFILPAMYEPFGMTALEAMACSVPAIISNQAGIQENLKGGTECLLVNPSETDALANAITSVLKDKNYAGQLASTGCRMVREQFSWDAIARRTVEFYLKCNKNV